MDAQVFVKIDKYRKIMETVGSIRAKVDEAKKILSRINELKEEENREIETWGHEIDSVEEKLNMVTESLSKSQNE